MGPMEFILLPDGTKQILLAPNETWLIFRYVLPLAGMDNQFGPLFAVCSNN